MDEPMRPEARAIMAHESNEPLILPPPTQGLWDAYLAAETVGHRARMAASLDAFIEALLAHDPKVWQTWACDLARDISDRGAAVPLRFPLFKRVLLPALVDGVIVGEPGCARWLGAFGQFLHQADLSALPETMRSSVGLNLEALRVAAGDQIARARLVDSWADYLAYTIHEVPCGVLYDRNGTTIAGCDELLELLADFRRHVEILGRTEQYVRLINDCAFHYRWYREYLTVGDRSVSYQRFLIDRGAGEQSIGSMPP